MHTSSWQNTYIDRVPLTFLFRKGDVMNSFERQDAVRMRLIRDAEFQKRRPCWCSFGNDVFKLYIQSRWNRIDIFIFRIWEHYLKFCFHRLINAPIFMQITISKFFFIKRFCCCILRNLFSTKLFCWINKVI